MTYRHCICTLCFILLFQSLAVTAEPLTPKPLDEQEVIIYQPFVRSLPPSQRVTAAFFGIENRRDQALTLIGATTDVAQRVELHTHRMKKGMMSMQKLDQITINAKNRFKFAPGAYHLMLINLKKPLRDGDTVHIDLAFKEGYQKRVAFTVRSVLKE